METVPLTKSLSMTYFSMNTLIKQGIVQVFVLVDDVVSERFKLSPNYPASSTCSCCCAPVQVVHTGANPF